MLRPGYALSRLQAVSLFGSRKQYSGLEQRMGMPMPPGDSLRIQLTGLKLAAGSLPSQLSQDRLIYSIQAFFLRLAMTPMLTFLVTIVMTLMVTDATNTLAIGVVDMTIMTSTQNLCAVFAVVAVRLILGRAQVA